ncbi:MAG: hypothetical protein IK104_11080, partial [Clostridia bacterium]|nr:hypothetical protein [Clostridia bacterium]
SLRDLYAAAAHLFAKYCVAGVGYPEDIPTPAPCLSQKLHPLRCEAVFSPAIFCPNNLNGRR